MVSWYGPVQFSSVSQLCPTLCNPMNWSTAGLPIHHQLLEFTRTHAHWVSNAIQSSHPLLSPSPPAPNSSQNQGLFQWVNSSHGMVQDHANSNARAGTPQNQITLKTLTGTRQFDSIKSSDTMSAFATWTILKKSFPWNLRSNYSSRRT